MTSRTANTTSARVTCLFRNLDDAIRDGVVTRRPRINTQVLFMLVTPRVRGFIHAIEVAVEGTRKPPKIGMISVAMMALCSMGYEINHMVVSGLTREAMAKVWSVIEANTSSIRHTGSVSTILMGRCREHYLQLFDNMHTPISMRTSKDDPVRADRRNEMMKSQYSGTLSDAAPEVDWANVKWDHVSESTLHSCFDPMDAETMRMIEQATSEPQKPWTLPKEDADCAESAW